MGEIYVGWENGISTGNPLSNSFQFFLVSTEISLSTIINKLGRKLSGQEVKIQVDPKNVLLDALPIYKNPNFKATCPLRVSFTEQPAVDIGGPKREFFTRVFEEIVGSNGGSVPTLFEGQEGRLMPVYSSSILYSGIMTAVGKMIAHSIAQCGVGFPYLSPVCYWYLVTGDVQKAIGYANVTDIRDFEVSDLVKRVSGSNNKLSYDCCSHQYGYISRDQTLSVNTKLV